MNRICSAHTSHTFIKISEKKKCWIERNQFTGNCLSATDSKIRWIDGHWAWGIQGNFTKIWEFQFDALLFDCMNFLEHFDFVWFSLRSHSVSLYISFMKTHEKLSLSIGDDGATVVRSWSHVRWHSSRYCQFRTFVTLWCSDWWCVDCMDWPDCMRANRVHPSTSHWLVSVRCWNTKNRNKNVMRFWSDVQARFCGSFSNKWWDVNDPALHENSCHCQWCIFHLRLATIDSSWRAGKILWSSQRHHIHSSEIMRVCDTTIRTKENGNVE